MSNLNLDHLILILRPISDIILYPTQIYTVSFLTHIFLICVTFIHIEAYIGSYTLIIGLLNFLITYLVFEPP